MTATPPVRRRLLGSALREYREGVGYNLDEAARVLECDRSKISRIETGQRGIRAKELRELLTEYGVAASEQEALLAIAHRGRENGWWLDYRDVLSAAGQDYVIMEIAATEILAYEPNRVPDLLQTPQYARALADADPNCTSDEQRAHAVEVTLARQRIVLGDRDPAAEFVVTEGALRQAVGGPAVMRAQLDLLAGLGRTHPRASLRVLPFAAGAHAAAGSGPMTILRFAQTPAIGIIHLAGLSGGVSLEGRDDIARHLRAYTGLRAAALSVSASARLLRSLAKEN
jgi:transcriptional regulator with XRE-family HTH domain